MVNGLQILFKISLCTSKFIQQGQAPGMDGRLVIVLIHDAGLYMVNQDESTNAAYRSIHCTSNQWWQKPKAEDPQTSGITIAHVQVHLISLGY